MHSHSISPAIAVLRRFGFAAKGLVYLMVGFLAARTIVSRRGRVTDEQGALHEVLAAPFGKFLLAAIAAGLFAYAIWRLVEMWKDPGEKGKFSRAQALLSGLVYTMLSVESLRMVLGMRSSGGGDKETKEQAALLISLPFGHWLTIVVAVIAIGLGLEEVYKAVARKFDDGKQMSGLNARVKPWILRLGRLGIFARGVVGTVVGTYLLIAGLQRTPSQARGTRGAIESLGQQPFGVWILAVVVTGLASYGAYTLIEARYREIA